MSRYHADFTLADLESLRNFVVRPLVRGMLPRGVFDLQDAEEEVLANLCVRVSQHPDEPELLRFARWAGRLEVLKWVQRARKGRALLQRYGQARRMEDRIRGRDSSAPDLRFQADELKTALRAYLARLTPRERDALSTEVPLEEECVPTTEVAQHLGVTPTRVRQLRKKAKHKMRNFATADGWCPE
jgi:RNA polymerase sigma factor (sigma-70 family)